MIRKNTINKEMAYTIDLRMIEGDGSFPCPKCGVFLSPDDESEQVYTIVETKIKNDELVELLISCRKCKSVIRLTGFVAFL